MALASVRHRLKRAAKAFLPAPTRRAMRHAYYSTVSIGRLTRQLGVGPGLRYATLPVWYELRRLVSGRDPVTHYALPARDARFPIVCRFSSSDVDVFRQIFADREYGCVDDLEAPRVLIDCGANVGCATAWFLSRYPTMRAIAVEPDPANVEAMRRNLAPYGDRVTIVPSGVWSRPAHLRVVRGAFGDGREWATKVVEAAPGEPHDLIAVDIPTLIAQAGGSRIDVLKIDIEGSEGEVFAEGPPDWLALVDNIVIEIHGPALEQVVERAIPEGEFTRSRSGELTCYRRVPARAGSLPRAESSTVPA